MSQTTENLKIAFNKSHWQQLWRSAPGKADVRKMWMTLAWFSFIFLTALKCGLIVYDFLGTTTELNLVVQEWFLAILAGKATLASGAYIVHKKNGNGKK